MRSAFCSAAGSIELREVSRPQPGAGEVLVRVAACGVCGSDLHWFHGAVPPPPVCPGHEISGTIEALGADVHGLTQGASVVIQPLYYCRQCSACRSGNYQLCSRLEIAGMMRPGGFAEYMLAPAYGVFPVPHDLNLETAALAEPAAVCIHALRIAPLAYGQRVLILGAGTIGLLCVLAARSLGAGEIAITARYRHQAETARRLGAHHVFEGEAELERYAEGSAVDVVVETVGGTAPTLDQAIRTVRAGGTVVVLGVFSKMPPLDTVRLVIHEVRIVGSMVYGHSGLRPDFSQAIEMLARNSAEVALLVTHRFPLEEIQQAFETASDKRRGAIKVLVKPAA